MFGKIMNYDKIDAKELGQSLKGLGINLLVSSVKNTSTFLRTIFNIELFQQTDDFAIAKYENQIFQLHADTTYHNNPNKDIDRKLKVNDSLFLIVEFNKVIIGSAMISYDGHRGSLYYLAVDPKHQRKGVGKILMKEIEKN